MGRDKLQTGYKKVVSALYSTRPYFKRIEIFLEYYKPTSRSRVKFRDIRAFLKSTWKIGIFSRASIFYWKIVIKTILTKRKSFPAAIEQIILWDHFRRVARKISRSA